MASSVMTREKFLQEVWHPYPSFKQDPKGTLNGQVAGRVLTLQPNSLTISTSQGRIEINFKDPQIYFIDENSVWNPVPDLEYHDLIKPNDIVATQLENPSSSGPLIGKALALLVPTLTTKTEPVSPSREIGVLWNKYIQLVREYFGQAGFLEADTPYLVECPGMEPFLEGFQTEFQMGQQQKKLYLPTSPELHLKKLLASDWGDLFEIKKCFRNGELGAEHEPEFWMLEWYRSYSDLKQIQIDVMGLIEYLGAHWSQPMDIHQVNVKTVAEHFEEQLGVELTPQTPLEDLKAWAHQFDIKVSEEDSWDDLFFWLFLEKIETQFKDHHINIVTNYPPSQAALAKLNKDGWAERFEIYWGSTELANAFEELNDPLEQERRFQGDILKKKEMGRQPVPIDQEFLKALKYGMPPAAGIALGLDRLFMKLIGHDSLKGLRPFPFKPT